MQKEKVSFILPIYKTPEEFLRKCVESICNQTYENIEILLIEDGSPDDCPKICDALADIDSRIQVIHQENQGVSAARNNGVLQASGDWICFIDPDDWVDEDLLTNIFENSKGLEPLDVVFWDYTKEFGKVSQEINHLGKEKLLFSTEKELENLHLLTLELTSGLGSVWAKLYRKSFLIEKNLCSNITLPRGQDVEFNVRVFEKVKKALFIPEASYHYRYDDDTASTAFNKNFADYLTRFTNALHEDIEIMQKGEPFKQKLYERSIHALLAISVRYTFHPNNPEKFCAKIKSYRELCKKKVFALSIKNATYKNFGIARKVALFCLKTKFIFGIYMIAKVRQLQYKVKQ